MKISDNEIQFVSGLEDYDAGIKFLQEKYDIKLICLTLGKDGSRAYYNSTKVEVAGFYQGNVVDTTGAGDAFCGSVLSYICDYGLNGLSGENLLEMITFANAAASLVTTKKVQSSPCPIRMMY